MNYHDYVPAIARACGVPGALIAGSPATTGVTVANIPYWHRCPLCREREVAVQVSQGERVCVECAQDIPIEMLPEDWR